MHIPINPPALTPVAPIESSPVAPGQSTSGASFGDILSGAIGQVEGAHNDANQSVARFLSGEGDDLHSTILASQRADLEFQMFMQVRNKVVSAYQEVMRMQM
jgi:flagellar hook-basal body complex protein FliE